MNQPIGPFDMIDKPGDAARLTVYFGSKNRVYAVPAFEVICELLPHPAEEVTA